MIYRSLLLFKPFLKIQVMMKIIYYFSFIYTLYYQSPSSPIMSTNIFFMFTLVTLTLSFSIHETKLPQSPILENRIPEYIGLGYHALLGNPFTNKVDEGFRAPIFAMSYSKGQKTEDGVYIIPDHTHSTQSVSCSLQSRVSTFTGTENYQKELSRVSKLDTKLSYSFLKAAFSFSRTFQQFSNSTQSHKQTSCQSNAECTVYTISMPIFTNEIPLSNDFIQGVKQSFASNNWVPFISHFGTHYATSVTFGGRYFLEHTYTEESMSLFKSMNLDIAFAAKIQFFNKVGISLSDEMKRYQNQTQVINSKVETTRLSTLGGTPPKSGNWIDWANTVKTNLAPVSYQLFTISNLFNFIHGIDAAGAIKSFEAYLNTFCDKHTCPPLTPERPPVKPLAISFAKGPEISGQSKNPKTYDTNDGGIKVSMRVNKVIMGSQGSIDSIQIFLSDGIIEHILPKVGTRNFNHQYTVPAADEIKCIRFGITHNGNYWKFSSLQFITRKNVNSPIFAGTYTVNQYRQLCIDDPTQHMVGIYGHYGDTFDSIGFNLMKEVIQK